MCLCPWVWLVLFCPGTVGEASGRVKVTMADGVADTEILGGSAQAAGAWLVASRHVQGCLSGSVGGRIILALFLGVRCGCI